MAASARTYFERILCPIDLLPDSDEAICYAMKLAKAYGAKLFFCHSIKSYASSPHRQQAIKQLEDFVNKYAPSGDYAMLDREAIITEGEAVAAISQQAARRGVDMIVMRSRKESEAALSLSSTAEALCRAAPCPVLVIRPHKKERRQKPALAACFERILVAHDFSNGAELALSRGLSLAEMCRAELHLIHVLPPRMKPEAPELAFLPLSVESEFGGALSRLQKAVPAGARLQSEVKQEVREGHPYREVLAYAEEREIDLICMGASGADFGMRALFGSNADRVLRQAECPVLIARPLKPAGPESNGRR